MISPASRISIESTNSSTGEAFQPFLLGKARQMAIYDLFAYRAGYGAHTGYSPLSRADAADAVPRTPSSFHNT